MKIKSILKLLAVVVVLECLIHVTFDAWDAECVQRNVEAKSAMVMYTPQGGN